MNENKINIDNLFSLLSSASTIGYIGEPVNQLQHALQADDYAKTLYPDDNEFILACLFHDIGHLCVVETKENIMNIVTKDNNNINKENNKAESLGIIDHQTVGARYLSKLGFSDKVCTLVSQHVNAKRYLTAKNQGYLLELSSASLKTLQFQGGPMNEQECNEFEKHSFYKQILQLRECDEQAKNPNWIMNENNNLISYKEMIYNHLKIKTVNKQ